MAASSQNSEAPLIFGEKLMCACFEGTLPEAGVRGNYKDFLGTSQRLWLKKRVMTADWKALNCLKLKAAL